MQAHSAPRSQARMQTVPPTNSLVSISHAEGPPSFVALRPLQPSAVARPAAVPRQICPIRADRAAVHSDMAMVGCGFSAPRAPHHP